MHRNRTLLAALALATALMTWPAQAQQSAPDAATIAADEAARQAQLAAGPRFVPAAPGYGGCSGEPSERMLPTLPPDFHPEAGLNGGPGWQTTVPRVAVQPGARFLVSLRDKIGQTGDPNDALRLTVTVIQPDGSTRVAISRLHPGSTFRPDAPGLSSELAYPLAFNGRESSIHGARTVIWESDGRFIACDGFVVGA